MSVQYVLAMSSVISAMDHLLNMEDSVSPGFHNN